MTNLFSLSPESDSSLDEEMELSDVVTLGTNLYGEGAGICYWKFIFRFIYTDRVFPLLIMIIDIRAHFMGWCGLVPYKSKQVPPCIYILTSTTELVKML